MIRFFNYVQTYLFFSIIILSGCGRSKHPDVSHIPVAIQIERFDRSLDSLRPENVAEKHTGWGQAYGPFYHDFMLYLLRAGDPSDTTEVIANLRTIATQADFRALSEAVAKQFPDMEVTEKQLTRAFQYLTYYFPETPVPRIITFFSGFSVQVPVGDGYIGIGLDMFLGADSPFYPAIRESIPQYLSSRFTPAHLVPRVIETYLREEGYPEKNADRTLLEKMIYHGKILYLMDVVLPETADHLKIGYSEEELAWAKRHEKAVWKWFIEENLVYETDLRRLQRYLGEAPFTPEFGKDTPSRLGLFTGWQIVRKYMDLHPDITPRELLQEENAQRILQEARY